ncbi:unnamed protein product, partial [Symbiodinium sp. KB8]
MSDFAADYYNELERSRLGVTRGTVQLTAPEHLRCAGPEALGDGPGRPTVFEETVGNDYREAAKVQWDEHVSYDAFEPLSHEDSQKVRVQLETQEPVRHRAGFMCMTQLLADGLNETDKWMAAAGDIQCFPGLLPGQLVRIKKNIFGLATSPHEWWQDLQGGIKRKFLQDKCTGKPIAYVGSHVDDILIVAGTDEDHFDYIGSEIISGKDEVIVTQKKYAETRLFSLMEIPKRINEEDLAGQT